MRGILVALLVSAVLAQSPLLKSRVYQPLPIGSVTPRGWLLTQLQIQAAGLSGHLALFWPDIMNSSWIGGTWDVGLHERTPYWLNGIVPLAYLLRNAEIEAGTRPATEPVRSLPLREHPKPAPVPPCTMGTDMPYDDIVNVHQASAEACGAFCQGEKGAIAYVFAPCETAPNDQNCWCKYGFLPTTPNSCRCLGFFVPAPPPPPPPPAPPHIPTDIYGQVYAYLNYIMQNQAPSGWLGPDDDATSNDQYWGRMDVLLALSMYAEAEPETARNVSKVLVDFMAECGRRMQKISMGYWSAARYMDLVLSIQWLLDYYPQGQETMLVALAELAHSQGDDWEQWFQTWTGNAGPHGVNNGQALKSAAVWYRQTGNMTLPPLSLSRMVNMDNTFGMPTGMFCADETLCQAPDSKHPSRGTELCNVVETMFSYENMFMVHGNVVFADRAERIAYNALPATWASPTGGDMWAHQYLQAVNEIEAKTQNPHIWPNDGPDAEKYGLAPNYGCCTANFNQGWPKYASYGIFFTTQDGGVAIGVFAPAYAVLPGGDDIAIDTNFPFEDQIRITLNAASPRPLYVRIPHWAPSATVTVNGGQPQNAQNATMFKVAASGGTTYVVVDLNPEIRLETWYGNSVTVHRGALLFSVPINGSFVTTATYAFQSRDYDVTGMSPWRYALDVDPKNISASITFHQVGYQSNAAPFNKTNWPVYIEAYARTVIGWGLEEGSAAAPPPSPACAAPGACGPRVKILMVPHGGTDLRMAELPLA